MFRAHACACTTSPLTGAIVYISTLQLQKNKQKPITQAQGDKYSADLKAVKYVECSALTQKGLKNVFDEVRRQAAPSRCTAALRCQTFCCGERRLTCCIARPATDMSCNCWPRLFEQAILAALEPPETKNKKKCILL